MVTSMVNTLIRANGRGAQVYLHLFTAEGPMSNHEKGSYVPSERFYEGCSVTLECSITDGPFANGRTDRLTIRDPRVCTERKYLVRQSGYVFIGPAFENETTSKLVRQLHVDALQHLI
jgi:hypothetical protein